MKWVVLAVVVILAAPTIANRLAPGDSQTRTGGMGQRRGLLYRAVRRFGLRSVGLGFLVLLAVLAVLAYLLIRAA